MFKKQFLIYNKVRHYKSDRNKNVFQVESKKLYLIILILRLSVFIVDLLCFFLLVVRLIFLIIQQTVHIFFTIIRHVKFESRNQCGTIDFLVFDLSSFHVV